jgi:hypothetical protein
MYLKYAQLEDDWTHLALDRDQWRAFVNMVFTKRGGKP